MNAARIESLGDCALLIVLGERIDAGTNACAIALAHLLHEAHLPGVFDIAPAYTSVCVQYDPCAWTDGRALPFTQIAARVRELIPESPPDTKSSTGAIEVPVCYGGEFGPDLDEVAQHAGLDPAAVIERHCRAEYRVAMLGFAPGFPYLLGLDAALHTPRRASPRTRVPAGSVGIGGAQTGIYPRELPGGWQLIGRTPLALFDIDRVPPALFVAGQRVRFRAIDADAFAASTR